MTYFLNHLLYFFFYSFIGWVGETIYCSVGERKFINRGFLTGPLCPIYGTAGVVLSMVLMPIHDHFGLKWYGIALTAVCAMIIADIIEYLTSLIMEKLFNARWWDYTDYPFNLNGRICLRHTIYWGIAGTLFIYVLHPWTISMLGRVLPDSVRNIVVYVLLGIFAIDLLHAIISAADIRGFMKKLSAVSEALTNTADEVKAFAEDKSSTAKVFFQDKGTEFAVWFADISRQVSELKNKYTEKAKSLRSRTAKRQYKNLVNVRLKTDNELSYLEKLLNKISEYHNTDEWKD